MRNKELRLYGDLIYQHKPTIRTIIWKMFLDYFAKRNRHRESTLIDNRPLDEIVHEQVVIPEMMHFAIVQEGRVKEIIVVNPIIAETLRSKKIKFVEFDPSESLVYRGIGFKSNKFFEIEEEEDVENDEKD